MALRYLDSFDHYTTLGDKGWTSGANATIQSTSGRFSTSGLRLVQSGSIVKVIPGAALTTIVCGFSFRTTGLPPTAADFVRFYDSNIAHLGVEITSAGRIRVSRGGTGGTVLGTGTIQMVVNNEYYIEIKATIDDSAGAVVVRVNEVVDVNLSSVDTRNGGNASVDRLVPWYDQYNSGNQGHYDDLYILDTTGSAPTNDFLGDIRVQSLLPNGNGTTSNLVGSDGNSTDNYLLVDEAAPNSDTDYVESSTVNDKDTYAYGNLTPAAGTVYGVQICPFAKKTDAGTRSIKTVARHSGTEEDSADLTLTSTYTYFPNLRETKPGGGAWSISDVNGAEFGVKVSA